MPKALLCEPSLLTRDLSGRRYVVTGANSGIGLIAAQQLARQGAEVILGCRRLEAGEAAAAEIRSEGGNAVAKTLDLGSLDSVRNFAAAFLADHDELHGLVNNAGVMNTPQGTTVDGFETQIGVNHLGHVLLTDLLLPALRKVGASGGDARIVGVSSCFHDKAMGREGRIDLEDLHFERRPYDGWTSYAQSKLANLLHMKALASELAGTGVTAVSVHPGWVRTRLSRHSMPLWMQDWVLRPIFRQMGLIEPWEGTQTTLHALLAADVPEQTGAYFSQTGTYRDKSANPGGWPLTSPNPEAHRDDLAADLMTRSREPVGATTAA